MRATVDKCSSTSREYSLIYYHFCVSPLFRWNNTHRYLVLTTIVDNTCGTGFYCRQLRPASVFESHNLGAAGMAHFIRGNSRYRPWRFFFPNNPHNKMRGRKYSLAIARSELIVLRRENTDCCDYIALLVPYIKHI